MSERRCGRSRGASCLPGVALAALLGGCVAVGPDFVVPAAPTIDRYTASDPEAMNAGSVEAGQKISRGAPVEGAWWRQFASSDLDAIVALALQDSPALQGAQATVTQAEDLLAAVRGGRYPQVDLDLAGARGNIAAARNAAGVVSTSSVGPSLSYALDVFGATTRRVEQAEAMLDYQRAQFDASALALTSGAVLQAIALASALEQIRAVQDIIATDERNLELVRISQAAGKSAGLDVLTAESQLASDRALLPPLLQETSAARHALAVLVGKAASEWAPPDLDFASLALPQELPLVLPSDLVRRRPDIAAAEAALHASNAAIGIATAQLYPAVTLSAAWTAASVGGALFASPGSAWDIAASVVAPLFHGGTLRAQRAAAIDAYAAQLAAYRQTVLQAFGQVADALHALGNDALLLDSQRKALDAAQATLDLTQQSFQAGQTSFLQIVVAERLYQEARLGYVRAKAQRYIDSVQLFVAMGGAPTGETPQAGR